LLPAFSLLRGARDFRARVVDFDAVDFEPVERFEAVRVVAFADFDPLLRDEVLAVERDFEPALLRVVADFDLLALAVARLVFAFAPVRDAVALEPLPAPAVFVLRLALVLPRVPFRDALVLRVLRPRGAPRPLAISIMPSPASAVAPSSSSSTIFLSDPFFRAMSVSSKCAPMERNTGNVTGVPQQDHFRFIRR
jgi:hypothetical protein